MAEDPFDLSSIPGVTVTAPRKPEDKSTYLVYALPGVGKTTLLGSASVVPAMSPVILLDFENGSSALARKYPDVEVVHIKDWQTAIKVIEALANNDTKYKTVGFDSIGEAQEQILVWSDTIFRKDDKSNPYARWADVCEQLTKSIKALHASDMNVVALAHAEKDRDEFTNSKTIRPHFLGKKSHVDIPKIFDSIGYLQMMTDDEGNSGRVLQFLPEDSTVAKDRNGLFPEYVPHPDFTTLYGFVTEGLDN